MAIKHRAYGTTAGVPDTDPARNRTLQANLPDGRLWVLDEDGVPIELTAVRRHRASSSYQVGDFVLYNGQLYRCQTAIGPKAWADGDWRVISIATAHTDVEPSPIEGRFWHDGGNLLTRIGTAWVPASPLKVWIQGGAPSSPADGHIWLDTDTDTTFLRDGSDWIEVGPTLAIVSATEPTDPRTGELWLDTNTNVFKVWDGSVWRSSGGGGGGGSGISVQTIAPSSPSTGDAWLNDDERLAVWDGDGWRSFLDTRWKVDPTTGVNRTLLERMKSAGVDPEDFGAVGDLITDDTVAIKAWARWVLANRSVGRLPRTYKVTEALSLLLPMTTLCGVLVFGNAAQAVTQCPPPTIAYHPGIAQTPTTFTRAGSLLRPNPDGSYTTISSNVRRYVASKGVLIEPAATNELENARDLTGAGWSASNCTRVAITAPDGTNTAFELTKTTTSAASVNQILGTVSQRYAARVSLRAGIGTTQCALTIYNTTAGAHVSTSARIISGPGVAPTTGASSKLFTGLSTTEDTIVEIETTVATPAGNQIRFYIYPDGAISSVAGRSIIAWNPVVIASASAGIAVGTPFDTTRGAEVDALDITGQDWSAGSGLLRVTLGDAVGSTRVLWSMSDATNTKSIRIELAADLTGLKLITRTASADDTTLNLPTTSWLPGQFRRIHFSWSTSGRLSLGVDGGAPVVATGAVIPSGLTTMQIGALAGAVQSRCWHELVYLWRGALPDASMAALAA